MHEYQYEINNLRGNRIVMEAFHDISLALEGRERLHFTNMALEASADPALQAGFMNKLFKSLQKVDGIDFGKIPDSKGDLTKYVYYRQMVDCIDVLNSLLADNETENLKTLNKLHQILLDARQDFVFGYKTNKYIIVITYNLLVTTLYELINVCAVDSAEELREKLSVKAGSRGVKEVRAITKTANNFINLYESGQWNTLMREYRKAGSDASDLAMEADADDNNIYIKKSEDVTQAIKHIMGKAGNTLAGAASGIGGALGAGKQMIGKIPMGGKVIGIILALVLILRTAIYLFIAGANKIVNYSKDQAELLRINADNSDESDPTVEQKRKWSNWLDRLSGKISSKILRTEKTAKQQMKDDDKKNFSKNADVDTDTQQTEDDDEFTF